MSLKVDLQDLYIDPISHNMMSDPVINASCGHTFEQSQIEGWIASLNDPNQTPICPLPLCNKPIVNLTPNLAIKQAIDILNDPDNAAVQKIEDLTTEEQEVVKRTADAIKAKRAADKVLGIPDRMPKASTFAQRFKRAYKNTYKC